MTAEQIGELAAEWRARADEADVQALLDFEVVDDEPLVPDDERLGHGRDLGDWIRA